MTSTGNWCKKSLRYQFSDEILLTQALTHRSATTANNERLEFLGDAVLGLTIASALYDARPDADEGILHLLRVDLIRRETLAAIARELDVGAQLQMSSDQHRTGGHQRSSVLANALEALFGAIFIESGYAAASETILHVFAGRLARLPDEAQLKDAKSQLQELLQARKLAPPEYSLTHTSGADHARNFAAECRIESLDLVTAGAGTSRQRAEQASARVALEAITDADGGG